MIAFCNDNEGGEMTREAVKAVLKAFPQASVMVRAFDRVHLMELDGLDLAFAQRELFESAVVMGRAALRASGVDAARSSGSSANIGRATASGSSCRARPATCMPGSNVRSAPTGRFPKRKPATPA